MIDAGTLANIQQKKLDSLAAKHLHVKRRTWLNRGSTLVDFLGLSVPTVYFAFRYLAKGTQYEYKVESAWEVLAALLLAATILKLVYRWQERAQEHSKLMGENISLVGQADNLLRQKDTSSPESARLFLVLAQMSETEDRNALGQLKDTDKIFAYREALKEFEPGNSSIVCPRCNSSPWQYTPGSCQLCGNTPTTAA